MKKSNIIIAVIILFVGTLLVYSGYILLIPPSPKNFNQKTSLGFMDHLMAAIALTLPFLLVIGFIMIIIYILRLILRKK